MRNIIILLLSFCIVANVNAKSPSTSEKNVLNVVLREVTPKRPRSGGVSTAVECYYSMGRVFGLLSRRAGIKIIRLISYAKVLKP